MDTMTTPGAGIGREIATGERADLELDLFISRRHEKRVKDEGERAVEEAFMAYARREGARRRQENRAGWYGWHIHRSELYARLAAEHAAAAEGPQGDEAA